MNSLVGTLLPLAERPFGEYELVAKLATGGMAEILLARQVVDGENTLVVIKRVLPHLLDESRFIAMFRDEGRLAAQIIHPNVCRVYESGTVEGTYFIAMEYLHGVPLSRMLVRAARTKKPLDIDIAVGIVVQCANGLHHAHELRSRDGRPLDVVHRDVSPPNIVVTAEGVAKMLDFGVAKARGATQKTRTGTVKGKNSYMSPEQILGKDVDRRSDVFSLGIVLWEALTSKRLFSRDTDFLTFTAITKTDIPDVQHLRPEVSDALAAVVGKALSQARDNRYSTAKELGVALTVALEGSEADAAHIAVHVQQAFSKELAAKSALAKNISEDNVGLGLYENTDAGGAAPGPASPEPASSGPASSEPASSEPASFETVPLSAPALRLQTAGVEVPETSYTESVLGVAGRERSRLFLAVGAAILGTALVAFLLTRGGAKAPAVALDTVDAASAVFDAGGQAVAVVAMPDAGRLAPAVDAAPRVKPADKVDTRPAFLTVDSAPYATIYVDGQKLGVTPIFKHKLAPGPHSMRAVSASGGKKLMRLNLKPGRTKNLGRLQW